jgi:hypothetical protein
MGEAQCGLEEHKKYTGGTREEGNREYTVALAKVYSCGSRARGLLSISFFF